MTGPAAVRVRERTPGVETFACHLCGGTSFRVIFDVRGEEHGLTSPLAASAYACTNRLTSDGLCVVECAGCRLRALHPLPDVALVEQAVVDVEDPEFQALEPHRARTFARVLRRIAHHRPPPGRLLDIGCYTGLFPEMALAEGWDVAAVEPSRWAAREAAARLPGRIVTGFVRDAQFPDASFDVVTAWDVIEHLSDPRADLAVLSRLLRPGGHLFLSTMDVGAPVVRLLGRRWPWYMPMHRYYFTPRTLAGLLGTAGFAIRAVEPYPHYTCLKYVCGKLEGGFGRLARVVSAAAQALQLADRTIRVNFGDVVFVVAQRTEFPVP